MPAPAEPPPGIQGSDDAGRAYASLRELWAEQAHRHHEYYAANDAWWDADGYGGKSDEEAMIGDTGSEADAQHSLQFLDMVRRNIPQLQLRCALDAGAGVGRVTKHVLLRRCESVCLVEACDRWLKQARRFLGNKRAQRCTFVHARLEALELTAGTTFDLIWVQWALQYLVDAHVVFALRRLAAALSPTGVLIVKENRPCVATGSGATSVDAFRVDVPEGAHGRYDVCRPDAHHRWLFRCAGLAVAAEELCLNGEVTCWALRADQRSPTRVHTARGDRQNVHQAEGGVQPPPLEPCLEVDRQTAERPQMPGAPAHPHADPDAPPPAAPPPGPADM